MKVSDDISDIVSEYRPRLLGYIRSQVNSREDAEDILQDVLYQLARSSAEEATAVERVSSWLYRVAHNTILNFWRKKRDVPVSAILDSEDEICDEFLQSLAETEQESPDATYLRQLVWQELDAALAELPREQREVFCLTVLDGIPVKDISVTTGISVPTLLSRKHYAVLKLRNRLHSLYDALINSD